MSKEAELNRVKKELIKAKEIIDDLNREIKMSEDKLIDALEVKKNFFFKKNYFSNFIIISFIIFSKKNYKIKFKCITKILKNNNKITL